MRSSDLIVRKAIAPLSQCTSSSTGADPNQHLSTQHLLGDLKGRTISSAIVTTSAQAVQFALTMLSTVVLARLLTPEDFGLVAMVITVTSFLKNFKNAGLSSATIQRENITHAQVSNLFWVNIGLGGIAGIVIAACAPAIAWFYREPVLVGITLAISVTFLLESATVQHMALLKRQMRFVALALVQIVALTISVTLGIILAWLKYGYWALVWAQITLPLCTVLLTWSISRWRPQLPTRRAGTRPLLAFGANLTTSTFVYSVAGGFDNLLIGRFFGSDAVGLYTRAGALIRRPVDQFLDPINAVFIPVLSRVQSEPERYRRTFLDLYESLALVSSVLGALCFVVARPITLALLGPKWEAVSPIFAAFTVAAFIVPLMDACTWLLESQGRGKDTLLLSSTSTLVSIAAILAGIPFGALGVAVARTLSAILLRLPLFYYLSGRSGPVSTSDLWRGFIRHLPAGVAVLVSTFIVLHSIAYELSPWGQLAVCLPTSLVVAALVAYAWPPSRRTCSRLLDLARAYRRRF
jgi:PST family polysaccharide transporter